MTIEEKAKAYDKATERAKSELNSPDKRLIEYIFPELKESEDERIRKELIKVFSNREKYLIDQSFGDITVSEALAWLEKQGEVESDNDDIEVEEKGIREAFNKIWEEKQDKQKSQRMISAEAKEAMYDKPADKVEPKFKVKYAGSEYNVLEIKEIAGDTYYGIEDEPNHIDYVLPDNCEIVSEQKSDWSEEDDVMIYKLLAVVELYYDRDGDDLDKQSCIDWLKALKQRIGG